MFPEKQNNFNDSLCQETLGRPPGNWEHAWLDSERIGA